MQGLRIDLKPGGGIVANGLVFRIDPEGTTRSNIRLRVEACDASGQVDPAASAWRDDIREGVHFLTRRSRSA